jgi:long-chain acyl-CoA synthetase
MEPTRLHDIPEYQLAKYPKESAIATKEGGQWKRYSTQQLIDTADRIALGLMQLGVKPGDKVAIASGNRSEWCWWTRPSCASAPSACPSTPPAALRTMPTC